MYRLKLLETFKAYKKGKIKLLGYSEIAPSSLISAIKFFQYQQYSQNIL